MKNEYGWITATTKEQIGALGVEQKTDEFWSATTGGWVQNARFYYPGQLCSTPLTVQAWRRPVAPGEGFSLLKLEDKWNSGDQFATFDECLGISWIPCARNHHDQTIGEYLDAYPTSNDDQRIIGVRRALPKAPAPEVAPKVNPTKPEPVAEYGYVMIRTDEERKRLEPKLEADEYHLIDTRWAKANTCINKNFAPDLIYRRAIAPGDGYHILDAKGLIEPGDEYYTSTNKWLPCPHGRFRTPAELFEKKGVRAIRRKLLNPHTRSFSQEIASKPLIPRDHIERAIEKTKHAQLVSAVRARLDSLAEVCGHTSIDQFMPDDQKLANLIGWKRAVKVKSEKFPVTFRGTQGAASIRLNDLIIEEWTKMEPDKERRIAGIDLAAGSTAEMFVWRITPAGPPHRITLGEFLSWLK
jgi:hypothetical protein